MKLLVAILASLIGCIACGSGPAPAPVTAVQLPKTGETYSFHAGDDGDLAKGVDWPDPRFTDSGSGTVTDNLTGLVWLKNAGCFGTKSWPDALLAANTMASGTCGLTDNSKAGDWRVPNINELSSLISIGATNPALPDNPFANVQSPYYWSSSTSEEITTYAWLVFFDMGYVSTADKTSLVNVWPVHGNGVSAPGGQATTTSLPKTGQTISYATGDDGQLQVGVAWPRPRFTDIGDGTVTDNLTGLVWLKNANCLDDTLAGGNRSANNGEMSAGNALTWANALASGICGLTDGSQAGDWRVPNRNELQSLIDRSQANPVLPVGYPFDNVQLNGYWTSSALLPAPGATGLMIWFVYLGDGVVNIDLSIGLDNNYVWPVRDAR